MTPPTTPTPPYAECGPFRWVQGELVSDGRWTKRDIERGCWREDATFHCQRCGTVHKLVKGKLVREKKPMPQLIASSGTTNTRNTPIGESEARADATSGARQSTVATPRWQPTHLAYSKLDGTFVTYEYHLAALASQRAAREAAEKERDKIKKWYEQSEDDCAISDDHLAELQDAMGCKTDLEGSQKKAMKRLRDLIAAEGELGDIKTERDAALARVEELEKKNKETAKDFELAFRLVREENDALRADSVPRRLVEEAIKSAVESYELAGLIDNPTYTKLVTALAAITKGEKE